MRIRDLTINEGIWSASAKMLRAKHTADIKAAKARHDKRNSQGWGEDATQDHSDDLFLDDLVGDDVYSSKFYDALDEFDEAGIDRLGRLESILDRRGIDIDDFVYNNTYSQAGNYSRPLLSGKYYEPSLFWKTLKVGTAATAAGIYALSKIPPAEEAAEAKVKKDNWEGRRDTSNTDDFGNPLKKYTEFDTDAFGNYPGKDEPLNFDDIGMEEP